MVSNKLRNLAEKWRSEAERLRRFEAHGQAAACEQLANELEAALVAFDREPVTIREASEHSGYSEDHLRRLVRRGQIPNAGGHNSPRIFRRNLPRKPHAGDGPDAPKLVDFKEQIARSVADSEKGGSDG